MIIKTYRTSYNFPNGFDIEIGMGVHLKEDKNGTHHSHGRRFIEDYIEFTKSGETFLRLNLDNRIIYLSPNYSMDFIENIRFINSMIIDYYKESLEHNRDGNSMPVHQLSRKIINYNDAIHYILTNINIIRDYKLEKLDFLQ